VLAECPLRSLDPSDTGDGSPPVLARSESECEGGEGKEENSAHHFFRNVKFLNLNYTCLSSWDDVDRLGNFPALQCLRLQGCPLFEVSIYILYSIRVKSHWTNFELRRNYGTGTNNNVYI